MARKNDNFKTMLVLGAAAAIAGGVAAYLRRKEIEEVVHDIADALDARDEDGFFSVDLDEEPVFHKIPGEGEKIVAEAAPVEVEESDFADGEAPKAEDEQPTEE